MKPALDIKGREIFPGDLLRSWHFYDRRARKHNYLYHIATMKSGFLYAIPYDRASGFKSESNGGCCIVKDFIFEVVASTSDYLPERRRVKDGGAR